MSIQLTNVSKVFGGTNVLNDINLTISEKTIYGLLGRNGAGKSTLQNIISDRLPKSTGNVTIDGATNVNNDAALTQLYLMNEANLYPSRARVAEIFKLTADFYGWFDYELATTLSAQFGLVQTTRFNKLSTGYRSILKLIIALCVDVKYVFLDEPTLGLDANHRALFYTTLLDSYAKRPRTFVISTHLIEEISPLIEHVLVLQNGQLKIDDAIETVLKQTYVVTGPKADVADYTEGENVIGKEQLGRTVEYFVFGWLNADRVVPDTVTVTHSNLQTLFVHLTSQEAESNAI